MLPVSGPQLLLATLKTVSMGLYAELIVVQEKIIAKNC